jgi:hypothetical protein
MTTTIRSDRIRAAHDTLQSAVTEIVSGDDWKRMLAVASNFDRYSFNNHLMIFLQRPDATLQPLAGAAVELRRVMGVSRIEVACSGRDTMTLVGSRGNLTPVSNNPR